MTTIHTQCCIAGGGPAGIMLGFLLARKGIEVVVLEKWPDFFRDFRGDTIHPSTMEVLYELGLLEEFLKLPHSKTRRMTGHVGGEDLTIADFSYLPIRTPYIAFIPQWDFLTFLTAEAKKYPQFKIMMETEATDIIEKEGKVVGVRARNKDGEFEIEAELVVGADGRHSVIRDKARLKARDLGAPIDVLWFKIPASEADPEESFAYLDHGKMLISLDRGTYWQCGFLIKKGDFPNIQSRGIEAFGESIVDIAPAFKSNVNALTDWDSIKLLTVTLDRLETWYREGLVCIGDSAHAMSPIGGVGINLAIQDAVAAANVLVPAFSRGAPTIDDLAQIQKRRELPTRLTQHLQKTMHESLLAPLLNSTGHFSIPWQLKILRYIPPLRALPAYFIGIGFRPEHIRH